VTQAVKCRIYLTAARNVSTLLTRLSAEDRGRPRMNDAGTR